ncbi:hypothetical protein RclHR1_24730002 [Rhizophagus clarus]|uniref:Uncharacterized protein n=1 Tax=Rhizophagus clarus TaxID=94130 RepID=A0A2Z6RSW9_9GLOM|nr:hypothetical protein RclHR1_24730002 [Rhizophagus clarus]
MSFYFLMAFEDQILNYGYKAVKSLNEIGAFSYNESSQDENGSNNIPISRNIEELQKKLTSPESDIDTELCDAVLEKLSNIDIKNLSWKDPIASQWPKNQYIPKIGDEINIKCVQFSNEYVQNNELSNPPEKFFHDSSWKESLFRQKQVIDDILRVLNEIWNNPIYSMNGDNLKILNEGTYFVDVINPILKATLKGIDCYNTYLTVAEMQSIASQFRKNNFSDYSQIGNKSDTMFALFYKKKYELLYIESSRVYCTIRKTKDDYLKLWHYCNDGISWIYNSCLPPKNQFWTTIRLNVLMKDSNDINHYFTLYESEIPLTSCEEYLNCEYFTINKRIKNNSSNTVSTPKKKKKRKNKK